MYKLPTAKRHQRVQPPARAKQTLPAAKKTTSKAVATTAPAPVTVKNIHKAPLKQWRKWSTDAKRTFNSMKSWLLANQKLMTNPKQKPMVADNWQTIAHNAAWMAADHVDNRMWGKDGVTNDIPDMNIIELFDA